MYYKVIKDNKVIDVLDRLIYVKYQEKHKVMVLCNESEAQGILSSDQNYKWHVKGMYKIPAEGYDTVELEQIDRYEYEKLRILNLKSPKEIADEVVLALIEGGLL